MLQSSAPFKASPLYSQHRSPENLDDYELGDNVKTPARAELLTIKCTFYSSAWESSWNDASDAGFLPMGPEILNYWLAPK